MSVIIRLQNLPWSANAADVRTFFRGLGIPDGGVHIVGGENGDAFIAFSTDEDARQAMMLDGGKLKETQVHLLLSSRAEMQKVIETARQQTISFINYSTQQTAPSTTPSIPLMQPQINVPVIQAQSVGLIPDQQLSAVAAKPQPPIITPNSLSGILAQQMIQQHQLQIIQQHQNMPVLTSTSVRHDTYKSHQHQYNSMNQHYGDNAMDTNKSNQRNIDNDSKRGKISRSRSRSRERRDRKRSRSRERSRRYRDRSRSRERRRRRNRSRSNDRRSRSHGRNSRDNVRKERSYEKDQKPSLDRNRNVDENRSNFNVVQGNPTDNVFNKQTNVPDNQKSFNCQESSANSNLNFNSEMNDNTNSFYNNFNNQSRNDFRPNAFADGQSNNQKTMGNEFEPVMPIIPFKQADDSINKRCCILIENLNNKTHYAAIRKFFYGLQIPNDGIKLLNDENGKRTGEVMIRFVRPDIAREALLLDGRMLNGQLVRIKSISDNEYNNEVDSFQPPRRGGRNNRYEDRNLNEGSNVDENNRENRQNRDRYGRGNQRDHFNKDHDGHGNNSNDSREPINEDDDVMVITDSNDGVATIGTTLLIEDLPPFAKEQDIIKMFSQFTLIDIVLAKVNKQFRAYVKFHNPNDAETALKQTQMHRIDFKSVFVSACTEESYSKAKREFDGIGDAVNKSEISNQSDDNSNNEMDQFGRNNFSNRKSANLQPPANNTSNIPSLFNLTFNNGPPFMPNTQAPQNETKFASSDPRLRRQIEQNNSQSPESQLSPSNQQQQPKPFNPFSQPGPVDPRFLIRNSSLPLPNLVNPINTKIVFIGNVEYRTNETDIVNFFADISVTPQGVYFVKNARGQPCGDCYVKFNSPEDATKALIKNRFRFRSRVIRVTLAEADDASKVVGIKLTDNVANDGREVSPEKEKGNDLAENEPEETAVSQANDNDGKQRHSLDMEEPPFDGSADRFNEDDPIDEEAVDDNNDVQNHDHMDDERFNDRLDNGNRNVDPRLQYNAYSRGGNIGDRSGNMMDMNMQNNYYRGGRDGPIDNRGMRGGYNQNPVQRNYEGCVVSLNNVPFAATPRDIAEFFSEYNLGPSDIIRRFNDDGSLTGEARVRFLTPMDAAKAIERHQRERIRQRVIHLRLVT